MRINFKKNIFEKRADSKLLSIWWFAVLIVIAVGVVSGVLIFYSNKADVRLMEAESLSQKIIDCIAPFGIIKQDFLEGNFNIYEKCGLNEKIIRDSRNFYLKISVFYEKDKLSKGFPIYFGASTFEKDCQIGEAMKEALKYPRCIEKSINVLDSTGGKLILMIKTGSNNEYRLESKEENQVSEK